MKLWIKKDTFDCADEWKKGVVKAKKKKKELLRNN